MEDMLSRNSFPQICVVSVNQCVGKEDIQQEYVRSGALSNRLGLLTRQPALNRERE
jgi:hypothetical protein